MDARLRQDFGRARKGRFAPSRRATFRVAVAVLTLLLPVAFWLARGWTHWHQPLLLGAVGALSLCSAFGELRFKRASYFTLDDAFAITALVVAGPLPAFLVLLIPDLVDRLTLKRLPLRSAGAWATYVSYGWCALAGAAVLALAQVHGLHPSSLPAMAAADLALTLVNWSIASALFATLWKRMRLVPLFREEFLMALPTQVAVTWAALGLTMLLPILGWISALPLSAVVLIPQVVLPWVAHSRDITRRSGDDATLVYARALLAHLGARRGERRVTLAAAQLLVRDRPTLPRHPRSERGWTLVGSRLLLPPAPAFTVPEEHTTTVWAGAMHTPERWDGTGAPAGLKGRMIPKESRLLAVAQAWASLTAGDGPCLPQTEAILALEAQAGTRFDPTIVAAASEIITSEAEFADIGTFEPRLALLPVPTAIRSGLLPWALRRAYIA